MGLASLIIVAEPTVRALIAVKEGKLSAKDLRSKVRKMGMLLLIESLAVGALIIIFLYI
ncbi:MAG: hypothetical protein TU36_006175 [Vulcanisaeta sp. AZ3]